MKALWSLPPALLLFACLTSVLADTPTESSDVAAELERAARLLEVRSRREVSSAFAGGYRSAFRGGGIEFEEQQVAVIDFVGLFRRISDLEVVGVLAGTSGGSTVGGVAVGSTDLDIYLPVTTAIRKLDLPLLEAPLDEIIVRLDPDASPGETARVIDELVDRLHGGEERGRAVVEPVALADVLAELQHLGIADRIFRFRPPSPSARPTRSLWRPWTGWRKG